MRIVYYSYFTGAFNQAWVYPHWQEELTQSGHDFSVINALDHGVGLSRDEYDDYVVRTVTAEHKKKPISLFLSSVFSNQLSRGAVKDISNLGIPTVNVTWDDPFLAHRIKEIASAFDLYWVADPWALDTLRSYGANAYFLPSAANPHVFRPHDVDEDVDVSFCGQRYGTRNFYINDLFRRGIDVELFGVGWLSAEDGGNPNQQQRRLKLGPTLSHIAGSLTHKYGRKWARAAVLRRLKREKIDPELSKRISEHSNPPLPFDEMVRLFSRSKLTLSFNENGHTYLLRNPVSVIKTRDFEAVSSGACHFMRRMPEWQPYLEEDKEVLCYESREELADKIRFYLDPAQDAARARIRKNARERTLREHNWTMRFAELAGELGIKETKSR